MIRNVIIKNTATFDDTGIEVPEFKKVNFFYGANGSGKTTISNFIYEPNNARFPDCQLNWKNEIELKSLVYNKDFRDRNFDLSLFYLIFRSTKICKPSQILDSAPRNICIFSAENSAQPEHGRDNQSIYSR